MKNAIIESKRLIYRAYIPEDLPLLHKLFNEESRRRWFYFQEPDCLSKEFAHKIIKDNMNVWSHNINILKDHCGFGIILKETNELIGNVELVKCRGNEVLDDVNIGYQIGEEYMGNGYATEAVKTAVEWGFCRLREIRVKTKIVVEVEHENWPSRKVVEKAGFTFVEAKQYVSVYEITE